MKIKTLIPFLALSLLIGCKSKQSQINQIEYTTPKVGYLNVPIKEHSILAVLWQQHAAEYRALTYQAYNMAQFQLDLVLNTQVDHKKPLAIIADIDETVLNNSPYNGKMIELDEDYSILRWFEWGKEKKAAAIPGALDFFQYAKRMGVEVFYISNRSINQKRETIENLQLLGLPFSNETHVLLKEDIGGKEPRRSIIRESHEIVLFIGDNLSDFSMVFDNQPTGVRNKRVDSLKTDFGIKFIVLPNPMYGDWESKGIMEKNYNWTNFQKDSIRRSKVISY